MTMTTRPTLLLKEKDRVWVKGFWIKGSIRRHNFATGMYLVEMDESVLMHHCQRFIYRNRDEIIKVGGD